MSLLAVPAGVMLAAAAVIWLLNRKQPNIGGSWLTAMIAALFVWVRTLLFFHSADRSFLIESIRADAGADFPALFRVDEISRPYMFTLAALLLLLMLTAPSGIDPRRAPRNWSVYLVLCTAGYISAASAGIWPLIFCWTIIDVIELFSRYMMAQPHRLDRSILISMAFRMIGTLLAGVSLAMSVYDIETTEDTFISPSGGIVLLIACALRMGLLPLNQPYIDRERTQIELGMALRLISTISVMPILSRVPLALLAPGMAVSLSLFVGFASFMGALGWVLSEDAPSGYSYAVIAIAGMSFACTLRGQQQDAVIVWGISVVLFCAPLTLYDIHNRWMNLLLIGIIVSFSGLPYTPNAIGWFGLVNEPVSGMDILFIVVSGLLTGGAFIHVLQPGTKRFTELEPWMRTTYPIGFIMITLTHVLITMLNWESAYGPGNIIASGAAFAGALLLGFFTEFMNRAPSMKNITLWIQEGIRLFWRVMQSILSLDWLIRAGRKAAELIRSCVVRLSGILESSSGLAWELLLLALIAAAIFGNGAI